MSTHAYSEDHLVEQPAIGLFAALGRETKGEAVLIERLRAAIDHEVANQKRFCRNVAF